jgi:hypothetical protein
MLFAKLDAAAASIAVRHSDLSTRHSALRGDVSNTFEALTTNCEESTATVELWRDSDNTAAQTVDEIINTVGVAKDKVIMVIIVSRLSPPNILLTLACFSSLSLSLS